MPSSPIRVELPAHLGLTAAGPLRERLLAVTGRPVTLDAAGVEHLGGLCLQVLLAARLTWQADGASLTLVDPSPSFQEAWTLFGAPPLAA